ncbi:hypothetical protein [Pseudomonas sp. HAR-UPW-AIA-41]|uniref:hypothetical protein n=1 Tax=Pseudomonas sp. HAR-UPW-AIA-41 TaxID=1985301 RepID=UPI001143124B|nr:hypothetical protein [Pseudomonas sp. HAR-UPW-AIA-41]
MSFDIIVIKPADSSITDLTEVEETTPLGSADAVAEKFNSIFPGCLEDGFVSGANYSVEISLSGGPVESAHLTLHFGPSWSNQAENYFMQQLTSICSSTDWVAFAVSDNARIAP